ncbi:MAG: molybdopterin-dependent oxidoreductase [Acidimicrobiia bacterium]|nr:molybdopterin-dependent oxidoreductase [Acidimicrobiia bacterium]
MGHTTAQPSTSPRATRRLRARQVDGLLAIALVVLVTTGFASWLIGTGWVRWVTAVHGIAGLAVIVLIPAKLGGSVRRGLRRGMATRWLSMLFGVLVVATLATGLLHSSGLWYGVGYWSALWTHIVLAVLTVPLLVWHMTSRPSRVRRADLDRRAIVGGASAFAVAGATYGAVELTLRATPLAGGDRRFTGSHEVASFDPVEMPRVQWLNDRAPETPDERWAVSVAGSAVALRQLADRARPVVAVLDCTGGWWTRQSWDAVPLAELVSDLDARSLRVRSATGYSRLFPAADAARLYLAVGYGGMALRRGHGAPVRLVAPGRRGYWWVKWVTDVEPSDRPWWLQSPFPLD